MQLFFFSWYVIQWLDVQPVQLSNWFPAFILYRQPLMSCLCLALVPMWINGFTRDRQSQLMCYILWYEVKESLKCSKFILHLCSELVFWISKDGKLNLLSCIGGLLEALFWIQTKSVWHLFNFRFFSGLWNPQFVVK